ncbi:MAG: DUF4968 domain-containing protein, partial [Ktedonobacteraceae bacterium]|nr:DUF4968 domain-containing protein [Ktedonobacteraceae bacterium]
MADRIPLLPYNYYYSDPPALPIRQAGDTGGPTIVISAQLQEKHDTGVILKGTTSSGETVSIAVSILAHGIARVLLQAEQTVEDERVRLARELSSASPEVEQSAGKLTLRAQEIRVDIQLDPFHISFYDAADRLLLSQNYSELTNVGMKLTVLPFGFSSVNGQRVAFHDSFTAEPD